jgi:hypothetical protein
MMYREVIAVCSEIHTKHTNTRCGQNVELSNVKLVVGQKSIGLNFSKSRTESHVTYSRHHNSSRLFSPYLRIRGFSLSSIHGWKRKVGNYQKLKSDLPLTVQSLNLSWVSCRGLQDKYCHKSELHREYVDWGEKDNAGNRYFAGSSGRADYGPSPAEIVASNPTGGIDGCLLWVLYVASAT